jgi:protein SCO1
VNLAAGNQVWRVCQALLIAALLAAAPLRAQVLSRELPEPVRELELEQRLGERVPLDLEFTDSTGARVQLGRYFKQGRPVVVVMVYYNCPLICPLTLERLQKVLNSVNFTVGDDFNVVVVSFDTRNTTQMAAENKAAYLIGYNRPKTPEVLAGWEFHTSTMLSARSLAEAIGFRYRFIPETGEYSHPATFVVLTPEGVISRYLSGLDPDAREMRLALLEASQGKIAQSISDFFLHLCFRWDPTTGAYGLHAMRVMQITGFLTVAALGTLLAALKAGERARAWRQAGHAAVEATSGTDRRRSPRHRRGERQVARGPLPAMGQMQ